MGIGRTYFNDEEEGPLISGQNLFTQALDVLNTPQQALFGAAQALGQGENPLSGALQGMRTDASFAGFLPEDMPGREVAGLAGDILLDPINLLPAGIVARLLRGSLKGLEATQHGARILSSARKNSVLRALVPGLVHEDFEITKALIRGTQAEKSSALRAGAERLEAAAEHIGGAATREGITKTRAGELITSLAETPDAGWHPGYAGAKTGADLRALAGVGAREKLPESFYPTINQIRLSAGGSRIMGHMSPSMQRDLAAEAIQMRRAMDDMLLNEIDSGMATLKLDEMSVLYVTHAATDEFKKVLRTKGSPIKLQTGKVYDGTHGYQLARLWRGMDIETINTKGALADLEGYKGIPIKQVFETDPIKIQWMRLLASESAIADVRVFSRAAEEVGRDIADPLVTKALRTDPTSYRPLRIASSPDPRQQKFVKAFGLDKKVFESSVADHLDRYWQALTRPSEDPTALSQMFKYFDEVQSRWKGTTLAVIPAYHLRNVVGNLWNNWLGGLNDPRYYGKAAQLQAALADDTGKLANAVFDVGGIPTDLKTIRKNLTYLGITDQFRHYMAMDLGEEVGRSFGKGVAESAKRFGRGKAVQFGFKQGAWLEDNARIAHYLWKLDSIVAAKGGPGALPAGLSTIDHVEAALSVKKYLFDYLDLTDFEKAIFRRVMPFYSWTRFNLPLQLEMIVTKPHKFAPIGDFINFTERVIPRDREADQLAGDWIKENTGIPVRVNADGDPEYMLLGGWIPSAEVARLGNLTKMITDQLSPIFKVPIEQAVNKDFMFNRELERFPGESTQFVGIPLRKRYIQVLRNVRLLAEADRIVRTEGFSDLAGNVGWDVENQGQSAVLQVLRFFFGAKTYPLDVAQARRFQQYQIMQLRREMRRQQKRGQTGNVEQLQKLIEQARKEPGDYGF